MSLFLAIVVALFKSKARLEALNALIRQQLIVLRHKIPTRVHIHAPATRCRRHSMGCDADCARLEDAMTSSGANEFSSSARLEEALDRWTVARFLGSQIRAYSVMLRYRVA